MSQEELRRRAREAGLPKLEGPHLEAFARGVEGSRRLCRELPADLHWTEEMALTFRLKPAPETKR
jgi:hypothetical protein